MKTVYKNIIDYELLTTYDIKHLKDILVLPIKNEGLYLECFVCDESRADNLETKYLLRKHQLDKNEILFFLDDIETRAKLFKLFKHCMDERKLNSQHIEEFIDILLQKAITLRTSDIHIEGLETSMCIRFRIDGVLKVFYVFEKEFFKVISSFLKMKSKLDITQYRLPLDGAFSIYIKEKKYDFRFSSMPTILGESIVIRVLDSKRVKKDLKTLGFSKDFFTKFEKILKLNQGLVLISGPTGAGKSTTLYSMIEVLNKQNKKIVTIEDPVEYKIEQIQQINIEEEIGLSFDRVLKNILRQDPDIILIGEIRDAYSLKIALQASLTGHIVFASIHANNSIETLFRLIDLDANSYLLSSTLKFIISQRLVLKLCECNKKGCSRCNFTNYHGRIIISEMLEIDTTISSFILKQNSLDEISRYLEKQSFKTMLDDGKEKVQNNLTTLDEVLKVL